MQTKLTFLNISLTTLVIGFLLAFTNCNKEPEDDTTLPSVDSNQLLSVGLTEAQCTGLVTYNGGSAITNRGFCWSTDPNPTIQDHKTNHGKGVSAFTSKLTGLTPHTTYYLRAYATNRKGTDYGKVHAFTTAFDVEYVAIPAGTFLMGSPVNEYGHEKIEGPQHEVTLSGFTMSKYEITNWQYAAFLNARGIGPDGLYPEGDFPDQVLNKQSEYIQFPTLSFEENQWICSGEYENFPVCFVTWEGAYEYAKYAGGRLPTEAEWEYACRATTTTLFNTGNCITNLEARFSTAQPPIGGCDYTVYYAPKSPKPVGSFAPNLFGLYDMHGNVEEWVSDWYGPYSIESQTNPTGPKVGTYPEGFPQVGPCGVVRGGGWYSDPLYLRSALRYPFPRKQGEWSTGFGFRIVKQSS
jgi:formylglycine-generating enzyme required for sulfatase activity